MIMKTLAAVPAFIAAAMTFTATLAISTVGPTAEANAHTYTRPTNHYIRQVTFPGAEAGKVRVGLWIMNPRNGRVRLCMLDDPETEKENVLKCSNWAGGSKEPGRYNMMDIRSRVTRRFRRPGTIPQKGVVGVWVINYHTGNVRACIVHNPDDPAGSLKCSGVQ